VGSASHSLAPSTSSSREGRASSPAAAEFIGETESPAEREGVELSVPLARESLFLAEEKWPEVDRGGLERPVLSHGGPAVRIPFPPPASLWRSDHTQWRRRGRLR
jgi:hypothetical protein